jgi:hypothetical protein
MIVTVTVTVTVMVMVTRMRIVRRVGRGPGVIDGPVLVSRLGVRRLRAVFHGVSGLHGRDAWSLDLPTAGESRHGPCGLVVRKRSSRGGGAGCALRYARGLQGLTGII